MLRNSILHVNCISEFGKESICVCMEQLTKGSAVGKGNGMADNSTTLMQKERNCKRVNRSKIVLEIESIFYVKK